MVKVTYKGSTLAESSSTRVVEGNHGKASYYSLKIGDEVVPDAAWYYPQAYEKAKDIEGYVAFYKNKVDIVGN
ncbi:hypothetical protein Rhopal_001096-T1 [Rhodotorula paludigena]|uniref:DUF427 domain-containing protein n=1 Tax=Rhodotorula paludigena TaxID=86838 RepID=A0AAV5GER9_9BASI|nr:hypothetical protein Rhopal_001096-T1 [Rhodotorula paludigena]